jgi:serine protease
VKKSVRLFAGIVSALMLTSLLLPTQAANAATIKAASAVRSVKVSDAWISSSPKTARAKLTWTRPTATYGAKLVGYRIEVSTNKTAWSSAVSNTGSTATSEIVSTGLRAGSATFFRVRAITKIGASSKIGTASGVISKALTAAPQAPALLGLTKLNVATAGDKIVRWLPQTAAQKGSASTTYRVVAKATTGEEIACSATQTNYCTLNSLTAGVQYNVTLTARNSRGSEVNIDEFKAQDPDLALQWYLGSEHGIAATRAWTVTRGSSEVVVAVLDSGITSHPEFDGQLVDGYDFVADAAKSGDGDGRDADPTDPGDGIGADTSSWHGTHVAGIIAAKSDTVGVSGIAPNVKIQPIRVLGVLGEGSSIDLALAIRWAAGQDLNGFVINN